MAARIQGREEFNKWDVDFAQRKCEWVRVRSQEKYNPERMLKLIGKLEDYTEKLTRWSGYFVNQQHRDPSEVQSYLKFRSSLKSAAGACDFAVKSSPLHKWMMQRLSQNGSADPLASRLASIFNCIVIVETKLPPSACSKAFQEKKEEKRDEEFEFSQNWFLKPGCTKSAVQKLENKIEQYSKCQNPVSIQSALAFIQFYGSELAKWRGRLSKQKVLEPKELENYSEFRSAIQSAAHTFQKVHGEKKSEITPYLTLIKDDSLSPIMELFFKNRKPVSTASKRSYSAVAASSEQPKKMTYAEAVLKNRQKKR